MPHLFALVAAAISAPAAGLMLEAIPDQKQATDLSVIIGKAFGMGREEVTKGVTEAFQNPVVKSAIPVSQKLAHDPLYHNMVVKIAVEMQDYVRASDYQLAAEADQVASGSMTLQEFFARQSDHLDEFMAQMHAWAVATSETLPSEPKFLREYAIKGADQVMPLWEYYAKPYATLRNTTDEHMCTEVFAFLSQAAGIGNPTRYLKEADKLTKAKSSIPVALMLVSTPQSYPTLVAAAEKVATAWELILKSFNFKLQQMLQKVAATAQKQLTCPWYVWKSSEGSESYIISPNTEHWAGH